MKNQLQKQWEQRKKDRAETFSLTQEGIRFREEGMAKWNECVQLLGDTLQKIEKLRKEQKILEEERKEGTEIVEKGQKMSEKFYEARRNQEFLFVKENFKRVKGDELMSEGNIFYCEKSIKIANLQVQLTKLRSFAQSCYSLRDEGNDPKIRGDILVSETDKIKAKIEKEWIKAIEKEYGEIRLKWIFNKETRDYDCHLDNGEIYKC